MTPLPPCSTLFPYTTLFRSVEFSARARAVTLLERTERAGTGRVGLTEARTVVVGGRGTDGDFTLVEELADELGGAVGATRVATDEGWIDHSDRKSVV